jgi:hypothetical protein
VNTAQPQELFRERGDSEEKRAPLWQDKGTPRRTGAASPEPSDTPKTAHSGQKHHGSQKRQLREVSGCIPTEVFTRLEIMRHAGQDDEESRSSFVGKFVTQGVQRHGDRNNLSMIEPYIEGVMDRKLPLLGFNRPEYPGVKCDHAAVAGIFWQVSPSGSFAPN